jgi:hypothetical protein
MIDNFGRLLRKSYRESERVATRRFALSGLFSEKLGVIPFLSLFLSPPRPPLLSLFIMLIPLTYAHRITIRIIALLIVHRTPF